MKRSSNPLQVNWRRFSSESNLGRATIKHETPELKTTESKPITRNIDVKSKANNPGGLKPLGLSKYHNNSKNVTEKFNKSKNNLDKMSKLMHGDYDSDSDYNEFDEMYRCLTEEQQDLLDNFQSAKDYSRVTKKPARAGRYNLDSARDRRLAITLSTVISKVAEDNVGATIDGDDFWDADRLAMRTLNKESIYKCRNTREKHNVLLLLDSSPSCARQSDFYSKIATQSTNYGDIELYDAPNARLVHIYNSKKKEFVEFLTVEDVCNDVHRWSLFKNRTIIFFGDFDGFVTVAKNTIHNKVYYFCTENRRSCLEYMKSLTGRCIPHNFRNLTMIPNVVDRKTFMEACKKLK